MIVTKVNSLLGLLCCGVGMGCTPSSGTAAIPNNGNGDTSTTDGDVPGSLDRGGSGDKLGLTGGIMASKNGSGDICESVRHKHKVECTSDKEKSGCPVDEDSESESTSLLCANLRRNFMGRNGSRSSVECRRKGSSVGVCGVGGGKQALAATAEEQSSEDGGDNNPLLKHSANPGDVVVPVSGSFAHVSSGQHYVHLQQHQPGRKVAEKVTGILIVVKCV